MLIADTTLVLISLSPTFTLGFLTTLNFARKDKFIMVLDLPLELKELYYLNDENYTRENWINQLKNINSPHYEEQLLKFLSE